MRTASPALVTDPGSDARPGILAFLSGLCVLAALMGLGGCVGGHVTPLNGPRPTYPFRALETHSPQWILADSLWDLRADPAEAIRCLKTYRKAVKRQKKVPELQARLSHACYFVAAFVETSLEKKDALFREGEEAAEKAMLQHPGYAARYRESGDETDAARELDSAYVEALYWYVANLGRELNQESAIIRQGNKDRVVALTNRLLEMDDTFYYGGPHRIAGAIPTRLPNGDLKEAKAHFEKAIALAPGFLGNRLAYADFYATRAGDKRLFLEQLAQVTAARADSLPEIGPENRFAQEMAKAMAAKASTLFK
ncbi:MAG: hypothetical protein JWP91_1949 [Fibrobacteres bacterium]|nr:hypothetical protein [Fibrobacterota bacterium]